MAQYQDNRPRTKGDTGDLVLAVQLSSGASQVDTDGAYTPLQTDASGNLRVNVAAGGTSGQQYADGTARGTATGTLAMGDDGSNIQSLACDTGGFLRTDIAKISGGTTVTASAGIQRVQSISSDDSSFLFAAGLSKTPTFLQISASASGLTQLVASAAGSAYRILAYNFMTNGAVNVQFYSSATPMGGIAYCPTAGIGKVAGYCPVGWMQTTAGQNLQINLSANIAVGGEIVYIGI
jgi:hypothetical protein